MNWNRIVEEYGEAILRASYRVVGNIVDAEDVAQDVLLEAFQKYQSTGQLPEIALLSRMATLRAIDHLRKKRPMVEIA